MTDKCADMSICVRCLLSDGWPKRLLEALPAERELTCETLRLHYEQTGKALAEAECLAGRGHGHVTVSAKGILVTEHKGSYCYPWEGSFNEAVQDRPPFHRPRCADYIDGSDVEKIVGEFERGGDK